MVFNRVTPTAATRNTSGEQCCTMWGVPLVPRVLSRLWGYRSQRVGEASNPGPPAENARGTGEIEVSGGRLLRNRARAAEHTHVCDVEAEEFTMLLDQGTSVPRITRHPGAGPSQPGNREATAPMATPGGNKSVAHEAGAEETVEHATAGREIANNTHVELERAEGSASRHTADVRWRAALQPDRNENIRTKPGFGSRGLPVDASPDDGLAQTGEETVHSHACALSPPEQTSR